MSQEEKQKPRYIWDYFRGGRNPFASVLNRNSPENLRKRLEALKLKQEIERQKRKTQPERRIAE
jgi:hypothetical protein